MQKLKLKSGQITQTWKLPLERPRGIIVECSNGEEFPVEKIYKVTGRGESIKILIGGEGKINRLLDKIEDLESDIDGFEKENKDLREELKEWQQIGPSRSEISCQIDDLEDECNSVQTAIENMEEVLELSTVSRATYDRIDELAEKIKSEFNYLDEEREKLEERIRELEVDNQALAWQIKELEKWKENTLKDDNTILH